MHSGSTTARDDLSSAQRTHVANKARTATDSPTPVPWTGLLINGVGVGYAVGCCYASGVVAVGCGGGVVGGRDAVVVGGGVVSVAGVVVVVRGADVGVLGGGAAC